MKPLHLTLLFLAPLLISSRVLGDDTRPLYKDPSAPVEQRVEDLMKRMTPEEKIGQLIMEAGTGGLKSRTELLTADNEIKVLLARGDSDTVPGLLLQGKIGAMLGINKLEDANNIQRVARKSRLGIPVLIGTDAIHGVGGSDENTTTFPSPITMAATFDPSIVQEIAKASAAEGQATGQRWFFAPNIDVSRDPRWGRMGETFGEDPLLVSDMGEASVLGMQSPSSGGWPMVAACIKHLVGGGQPANGLNGAPFLLNEWELRSNFLPPFERCVKAGALTLMAAHNEAMGVPCHSSHFLLDQILRKEWGFKGTVVSDWGDVEGLFTKHDSVEDTKEAVVATLSAGIDLYMTGQRYADGMKAAMAEGLLSQDLVDRAVRRVLTLKFQLGLFEDPMSDPAEMAKVLRTPEHLKLSLQSAREGVVLLENKNAILPLDKPRKILVTGPNATNASVLGDWVLSRFEAGTISVLKGMKEQAPTGTQISYADTGDIRSITDESIAKAVQAAKECDVVVAVVGEVSLRSWGKNMTCGENHDRTSLTLYGRQDDLLRALYQTGKPVVVVLVNGRALCIGEHAKNAAALIEAWEPGELGGQAIAEILYGKVNPSGRLPVTFPATEGDIPIYYYAKKTAVDTPFQKSTPQAQYWFGAGLSYTTFKYSNLKYDPKLEKGKPFHIEVTVRNTGTRDGDEVVMVYTHDPLRSTIPPVKELRAYRRISLRAGEEKVVNLSIPYERFAIWNAEMKRIMEPGGVFLNVGSLGGSFKKDKDTSVY